jgi:hypothetical protein
VAGLILLQLRTQVLNRELAVPFYERFEFRTIEGSASVLASTGRAHHLIQLDHGGQGRPLGDPPPSGCGRLAPGSAIPIAGTSRPLRRLLPHRDVLPAVARERSPAPVAPTLAQSHSR